MFKLLVLIACLSIVASTDYDDDYDHKEDFDHPKYKFEHAVKDSRTGVHKTYSRHEEDGTELGIEYKSDDRKEFEVLVQNVKPVDRLQIFRGNSSHGRYEYDHGTGANNDNGVSVDKCY
uniref:Uncharacterized protein n=1 Tax=Anopheles stephensi TaxID=30069 RepID=A0A182Y848_ANOST